MTLNPTIIGNKKSISTESVEIDFSEFYMVISMCFVIFCGR